MNRSIGGHSLQAAARNAIPPDHPPPPAMRGLEAFSTYTEEQLCRLESFAGKFEDIADRHLGSVPAGEPQITGSATERSPMNSMDRLTLISARLERAINRIGTASERLEQL